MPCVYICVPMVAGGFLGMNPRVNRQAGWRYVQVSVCVQVNKRVCKAWVTVGATELRLWKASLSL